MRPRLGGGDSAKPLPLLTVHLWDFDKSLNISIPHLMVSTHIMKIMEDSYLPTLLLLGHTSKISSCKSKAEELKEGMVIIKFSKEKEIHNQKGWPLDKLIELVFSNTRNDGFDLKEKINKCFTKEINSPWKSSIYQELNTEALLLETKSRQWKVDVGLFWGGGGSCFHRLKMQTPHKPTGDFAVEVSLRYLG